MPFNDTQDTMNERDYNTQCPCGKDITKEPVILFTSDKKALAKRVEKSKFSLYIYIYIYI